MRSYALFCLAALLFYFGSSVMMAAETPSEFLAFVRQQAAAMRAGEKLPATRSEWEQRRTELRTRIEAAWGGFPKTPCPLEAKILGVLRRDGYRVEKVIFQTRPGVWMTANAYVPDRPGKLPAVLGVHGHWPKAKQDPTPQMRFIGLARQGYFVLAVDAFGAGERGLGKALGEYHGEMVAGTLWPVGLPLSGLQVYENMRAVDYLLTRPEVDGKRLAVTGASGGGNQSMYAGAWDDRFAAAVPVCSVGNYQAYLGVACCMCEVVPGALQFMEEWSVLALTAPRALMVVNATHDGVQFSIAKAKKSIDKARPIFQLYGQTDHLRHATFEASHGYNQAMRETMYGWMARHLQQSGDGSPIPEPPIQAEDPETLRCFPGQSRPDDFMTIPKFAAAEGRKLLARIESPKNGSQWQSQRTAMVAGLAKCLDGGKPVNSSLAALTSAEAASGCRTIRFQPEPGVALAARQAPFVSAKQKTALVLDLDQGAKAAEGPTAKTLREAGWSVITVDLRATGSLAWPHDSIGRAPDHNTAEWSLWLGRPLLGQWVTDVRRLLDALAQQDGGLPESLRVVGVGTASLVALCAAACDERISEVATIGGLSSYITEEPYQGQRLGLMAPAILRECGDVSHLAALIAPRKLLVAGAVSGGGKHLSAAELHKVFAFTQHVFRLTEVKDRFRVVEKAAVQ